MERGGQHRRPKAVRLLAAAGAVLVAGGAAAGIGAASAGVDGEKAAAVRSADPGGAQVSEKAGSGPSDGDFVDIRQVQPGAGDVPGGANASAGTFVSACGNNENGHNNPDNFIVAPGVRNGAHHMHDYVGNQSTDANSNDQSLAGSGTTCKRGDLSTYYWPVLRDLRQQGQDAGQPGGGQDGNVGSILQPDVTLQFRGNPKSEVTAMPRFLRAITGDAKAVTNGPGNAKAQWTCTGLENRVTTKYPLCPGGSRVERILDFPSCWDGANTDSADHRSHLQFPGGDGSCQGRTRAVPQLRMKLTYAVPPGRSFAIDAFGEEKRNPITDHGDFVNVMPDQLMDQAVRCINSGQNC